jgi:hypothetical protein
MEQDVKGADGAVDLSEADYRRYAVIGSLGPGGEVKRLQSLRVAM